MFTIYTNDKTKASAEQKSGLSHPSLDRRATLEPNPIWQTLALRSASIQPKLTIGRTDDPFEREADQIADHVMRMAAPSSSSSRLSFSSTAPLTAQRKCQECEDEEEKKLQRKEH